MSKFPEFDPFAPDAVPPQEDVPGGPGEEDELPPLEGMVFSSYLTPGDLDGSNWEAGREIPEIPAALWSDSPMAEEDVLKVIASTNQAAPPADPSETGDPTPSEEPLLREEPEPAQPVMDWLEPPETLRQKLTPLGRQSATTAHPGLYGNLADTSWLTMDRLNPVQGQPGTDPSGVTPFEDDPLRHSGPVGEALEFETPKQFDSFPEEGAEISPQPGVLSPVDSSSASSTPYYLASQMSLAAERPSDSFEPANPDPAPPPPYEPPLFQSFSQPERPSFPTRIPNFGHFVILILLGLVGLLGASLLTRSALYFHLWGISSVQRALTDIHYTIGSMASLYILTFGAALLCYPVLWHKSLFAGLQWNAASAARRVWPLLGAAGLCFVLAMVDEILLPGPTDAPIDKLFDSRAAAWLLFAFGVTFAPFFEETIFRGFLLPAFCTAIDWSVEQVTGVPSRPLEENGHPRWSMPAMVFASIATSVPFALMHAEQTGYSLGPFLLLVAVSLVLCWARLSTRSLAASVLVHATYNFMLFSLMLLGTSGFRHLDKM